MRGPILLIAGLIAWALVPGPIESAGWVQSADWVRRASTEPTLVRYSPPAPLDIVRAFQPPPSRYGPGHRGVDLRAAPGQVVRAAGAGIVTFAGPVAGRGVVVLRHRDGVTTEYEPVAPRVHAGMNIEGGQPIGQLRGEHRGCAGSCLHWGARRGDDYFDPLLLLRPLGPVVLLPWSRPD